MLDWQFEPNTALRVYLALERSQRLLELYVRGGGGLFALCHNMENPSTHFIGHEWALNELFQWKAPAVKSAAIHYFKNIYDFLLLETSFLPS